ncbi:MAG TPA: hypothetical protein VHV10_16200, partial [Ktedonobacteraceae bacterium]|nr:hypothetical protein [Ktedonobacteraceae bacterium]
LSPRFFLHNVYYCFINSIKFSNHENPITIDVEGNSVFFVYTFLLLLPVLFYTRKYADRKRMPFLLLAGIVIGLNLLVLMLYQSTASPQFGYRYFFDVLPLAFLLLMFILPSIPILIQMGLLVYGIFVNFYGTMEYWSLHRFIDVPPLGETLFWIVIVLSIFPLLSIGRLEAT